MIRPTLAVLALLAAMAAAQAQDDTEPFIWSDPDTGCAYLVAPGTGITPRLRPEGVPDCPDADVRLSESFERTLRESGEAFGRALQELGRDLEGAR
ncbi:hypothetical protein [Salinarimonas sp.]|uniref:hypothetical protein n=1 Tax=Salinarimonas sp. TaxID=2766526 RepID=UPI0032D905A1